jgi:hypothetical protein
MSLVILFSVITSYSRPSMAISNGAEIVSIAVGAGSVSIGRARNNQQLKYVGWGLIAIGGTTTLGDIAIAGMFGMFIGAFMGAWDEALTPQDYYDGYYRQFPRSTKNISNDDRTSLKAAMREVHTEILLAAKTDSTGNDDLVINSIARAVNVPTQAFAQDFESYITASNQNTEVDPTSFIHCTQDVKKIDSIKALFLNYHKVSVLAHI